MMHINEIKKSTTKTWTGLKTIKYILLKSEENVSMINATPYKIVQLENFSGAKFQYFTDMLKDKDLSIGGKCHKDIILALGINCRCNQKTSILNLFRY